MGHQSRGPVGETISQRPTVAATERFCANEQGANGVTVETSRLPLCISSVLCPRGGPLCRGQYRTCRSRFGTGIEAAGSWKTYSDDEYRLRRILGNIIGPCIIMQFWASFNHKLVFDSFQRWIGASRYLMVRREAAPGRCRLTAGSFSRYLVSIAIVVTMGR